MEIALRPSSKHGLINCTALLNDLQTRITTCALCPRLVAWRERIARDKVLRFKDQEYWGRPVPSFGDPAARMLILGLAPAAHGANRTGRMFTGDSSGLWLYRALHKAGFANQPSSTHSTDGLRLNDCYISAVIHCAPPQNKPIPDEVRNCNRFLIEETELLANLKVVAVLGKIAFDAALSVFELDSNDARSEESKLSQSAAGKVMGGRGSKAARLAPRPKFSHGAEVRLSGGKILIASFHPSQQNTFTGKLTEPMFDDIFARVRALLDGAAESSAVE